MTDIADLRALIEDTYERRQSLNPANFDPQARAAVEACVAALDRGELRVAEKIGDRWTTHQWLKKAVLLYFRAVDNQVMEAGYTRFFDKVPLKYASMTDAQLRAGNARIVPHAIVRKGAHIGANVVLMPSYVNIGAYVDEGTMVDTWATVGSCAQIGKGVHLSGGVGIGGVLEPLQASSVIIEDGCFIGSRCIVVEGVMVEKEAVLGANVVLTQSTKIIDVSGNEPVEMKGRVPARSVVIPGSYTKKFPAGEYGVGCALIIGQRKPSTDLKTSLNDALRDFNVSV